MKYFNLAVAIMAVAAAPPLLGQNDPFKELPKTLSKHRNETTLKDGAGILYGDGNNNFCSDVLKAANEFSLAHGNKGKGIVFRLSIKPTAAKPIVITMENEDGAYLLNVKRLSGYGGYEIGGIELSGRILIEKSIAEKLIQTAKSEGFAKLANMSYVDREATSASFDGTWWTLEVIGDGNLKIIDLHCPEDLLDGQFHDDAHVSKKSVSDLIEFGKSLLKWIGLAEVDYIEVLNPRANQ